jgi:predicted O-methyltransferase YrrM
VKRKYSKKIKGLLKAVLNTLPYVKTLNALNSNSKFPAGHYYSTVISIEDIKRRQNEIWKFPLPESINGIELKVKEQLQLLKHLEKYYAELPFDGNKVKSLRYNYRNNYYSYNDGIILYSMIRHYKPKNIIEIGSGYSSAVMMDTNDLSFQGSIDISLIEPFPNDRLYSLLKTSDNEKVEIIERDVQKVPLDIFKKLKLGDILFIDSTHAVKTGSDVNYILFEVLPVLSSGVLVHFHDIYYPFEYPKQWVMNGIGWNETYFLKSFLMYNNEFDIIFFSDYLHKYHKESFKDMPLTYRSTGSNLWITKK